ncbi:MAG: hypothetical protein EOO17_05485 [Chloroflexi bacterium]|nr:MAG: hypothetical protein EOO17_05485 [Chloroflexota bacterium]
MNNSKSTGIRKRQEITKANQTMFLWVAGVSVVVGFSLVIMLFLGQKIIFGEKVVSQKEATARTLSKNLEVVDQLRDNVRVLDTNEDLKSTRLKDGDSALQSVLDALPADANSTALGSSLQSKLLSGVNGVTIDTIRVDPVTSDDTGSESTGDNTIQFSFTVSVASTNPEALREVLLRLERSIRAINITNVSVERQGARIALSAIGHAYYEPAKTLELKEKVVKP